MSTSLDRIFSAHGGLDEWRRFSRVEADIVTGGGLFPLKGLMPDLNARRMTVWLRRHDYFVDVAGAFAAAQLTTNYIEADGIKMPSCRRAFAMGPDRKPISELLMVAIDISNVSLR